MWHAGNLHVPHMGIHYILVGMPQVILVSNWLESHCSIIHFIFTVSKVLFQAMIQVSTPRCSLYSLQQLRFQSYFQQFLLILLYLQHCHAKWLNCDLE